MIAHTVLSPGAAGFMERSLTGFSPHFILRLDAKGRISVPASFRAVLAPEGGEALFCYPALDRLAVEAGGRALMAEIEDLIGRFPPFSTSESSFATALYGTSETLKNRYGGPRDPQRTIEGPCRDHGRGGVRWSWPQFQIWAPDRFSARLSEATGKMRALRKRLGAERAVDLQGTGMMTGRDSGDAVDGGLARHIPVLAQPALHYTLARDGGIYIDGTFGAGGYSRAIPPPLIAR